MKLRLILMSIAGSFWFAPLLVALGFAAAAAVAVWIDARVQFWSVVAFFDISPAAARSVLSALAGGMMTVASIVFSLTFVALTTLSSQFGPRLLIFFMNDRATQIVLGVFVGGFLFALIALLSVQEDDVTPVVSLFGAVLLSCGALGVMIFFIHHIARSIQADVIVARLGEQLTDAVDNIARRRADNGAAAGSWPSPAPDARVHVVGADQAGYVQIIDAAMLAREAAKLDGRVDCLVLNGDFVLKGQSIAELRAPADAEIDPSCFQRAIALGSQRTPAQEVQFEMTALNEVAVRALSPGVNDPNTAAACVHRLAEGLAAMSAVDLPGDVVLSDEEGRPRARLRGRSFEALLETAFAQIRRYARDDANVFGAMIDAHAALAEVVGEKAHRAALAASLKLIEAHVGAFFEAECDRDALMRRVSAAEDALRKTDRETSAAKARAAAAD